MSTTWFIRSSNHGLSIIKTFEHNVAFFFRAGISAMVMTTILEPFVKCELKSLMPMPYLAHLCISPQDFRATQEYITRLLRLSMTMLYLMIIICNVNREYIALFLSHQNNDGRYNSMVSITITAQ